MTPEQVAQAEAFADRQRKALARTITLDQQIASVRRELAMRHRVYPKWVAAGRMKQDAADHELAAMQAVHDTLTGLTAATRLL